MTRRILTAVMLLLLGRCAPVDVLNATIRTDGLSVRRGIAYGELPRQRMDVYRPAHPEGRLPVVVFFYGGSWQSGAREEYRFVAAALARAGMVVAVPDYRLYPEARFPTFLEDSAQAVAFVRARAGGWHGDVQRLFLIGHSAGAYNAAMLALDPRWLASAGMARGDLAGWVGISGPYDFLPIREDDIKAVFAPAAGDMAATQPISFADAQAPRTLLLQGEADHTVLPRNATALAARLGPRAELRLYPGVGHVGAVLGFAPLFRGRSPVLADVVRFVAATRPVQDTSGRQ